MLLVLLAGCDRPDAETRLRDTIAAMQAAVEGRDVDAVIEPVHQDFVGSHGLDRARLQQLLRLQVLRNRAIGVTLGPLDVAIDGEQAEARFVALTTGGAGGLIPQRARGWRVVTRWRLEGDDWRLLEADWTPERD